MYASMSTFTAEGLDVSQMATIAGEAMEGWLRGFDGYHGLLILTNAEAGTARVVTFWENREAAEQSEHARSKVRDDMATRIGATLVSVEPYEITYRADLALE